MASTNEKTPLYNLIGALIFGIYVVSALLLSISIIRSLFNMYQSLLKADQRKTNVDLYRRLQVFSALSVLSFSTLSYNMLSYLVLSYRDGTDVNSVTLPQRLLGDESLLSSGKHRVKLHVWQWLTSATLFKDFAETICGDSARFWWTEQALLVTMAWSMFMSFEGRKRNIPHLWAYALISQILPVSFALNLFFVAMSLKPVSNPNQKIQTPTPIIQLLPLVAYYTCVLAVPYVRTTRAIIGFIVVIRLLLFCSQLLPVIVPEGTWSYLTPRKAHWADASPFKFIGVCSALLWIVQTSVALRDNGFHLSRILGAINDSPAVSALGYDYILSMASLGVWALMVGSNLA